MAERVRVQKAIADAGLMSRRKAERAVEEGRVRIGGRLAVLGDRVDVDRDHVTLDELPVPINPGLETHLLYKPAGVISSATDPHGRTTVVDLIHSERRLYPVGRLDFDSEGLILVSNDGELTHLVTHPRHGITKKYLAMVQGTPSQANMRRLEDGIELEDGPARAVSARLLETSKDKALVELVMLEGRNREVRRMLGAMGLEVTRLVRIAIGPITDQALKAGESRLLTAAELRDLFDAGARG